jgi:Cyclic nucleotide-binding domain
MFAQLPERRMHGVRWVLTVGWLLVIASLFYDPWTAALTEPDHPWSPLRLRGDCVQVQDSCVVEQPYPLGATVFWGAIVPSGIFILLAFGHELWRRVCPLSFLSQIPRALGWQRQSKRENQKTGKVRYELAKVNADSWLGKNYLYVQFSWLFIGLCGRILFFNADRLVLGSWLIFTIVAAITVGYFYGGKSWCQYFCPMAPVQTVFSEPRGLGGSKAHMSDRRTTQSMCRTVLADGSEQSACVACQSPCIDIDSERTYWEDLNKPEENLIRYGYVGLVVGYFVYYYLYAGNWEYYFSGVWNRDQNQLATLMNPGLYLFGQAINIPKLLAVPLVLGGFTALGYGLGQWLEKRIKQYSDRRYPKLSADVVRHRIFAVCTFGVFNFFFFFAGRPLIHLLPVWVQAIFDVGLVFLSTLWLQKTWRRSPDLYSRENLASRFRKQLEKLDINVSQFLDGRSLDDLHVNEVYVLAKVLPNFTREKRHQAYKGVVREALEEGYVNDSSSLEVLQQMRQELGISEGEHQEVLEELGVEDPELLDPHRKRSLENQIRLNGYQKSLERLMRLQQIQPGLVAPRNSVRSLQREYAITPQEENWISQGLSPDVGNAQKAEVLLARLTEWVSCDRALHQPQLQAHLAVLTLLQSVVEHKQELIRRSLSETLSTLPDDPHTARIQQSMRQLLPANVAADVLPSERSFEFSTQESTQEIVSYVEQLLLGHYNPIVQAAALYLIAKLDAQRIQATLAVSVEQRASEFLQAPSSELVQETAKRLIADPLSDLSGLPRLERLVYLYNSDFFHRVETKTLIKLGDRAEVRTYSVGEVITEAGDTCRELLLLIEGDATVQHRSGDEVSEEPLHPGKMLDELEVLTRSDSENTILANSSKTRILAIPVDALDDLLEHDPDFARQILELEARQLQKLVGHNFAQGDERG